MPAIVIHSIAMTDEQKREVADFFVSKLSEVTNVPKEKIYLFFDSCALNDVSAGGVLFSDMPKLTAHCKFNEEDWNKKK
jgi:phenylpyruvate tautomerase PptA (4-oxalocrotonate tautomerase family)